MLLLKKGAKDDKESFSINVTSLMLEFVHNHFFVFYSWITLWLFSIQYRWPIALLIILYSASAGLLVYYSRLFLSRFLEVNKKKKHILLNKRFEPRFAFIFSFFSISTVVILF